MAKKNKNPSSSSLTSSKSVKKSGAAAGAVVMKEAAGGGGGVIKAVPVVVGGLDDNVGMMKEHEKEEEEEELTELLQVDVGDCVKLKQILDETVCAVLLLNEKKLANEDYTWDNIKLVVMTIACLFAVIAQFAPIPFPDSRFLLGGCCCTYFLLSGVLQFITTFIDKDSILMCRPTNTNDKDMNDDSSSSLKKVRVRTTLPRFSEYYTVIMEYQDDPTTKKVEHTWSVGQFFDTEGMFDEEGLMIVIANLYNRLVVEHDYDNNEDKKKKE